MTYLTDTLGKHNLHLQTMLNAPTAKNVKTKIFFTKELRKMKENQSQSLSVFWSHWQFMELLHMLKNLPMTKMEPNNADGWTYFQQLITYGLSSSSELELQIRRSVIAGKIS